MDESEEPADMSDRASESENEEENQEDDEDDDDEQMLIALSKQMQTIADHREVRRGTSVLAAAAESMREKLQHLKEVRILRSQDLSMQHHHVLDMVGIYLGLEGNQVLEDCIDESKYVKLIVSLLSEKGKLGIIFRYDEQEAPSLETGRLNPTLPKGTLVKRVIVTNGFNHKITGKIVVAYRTNNNKAVDLKSVTEEILFISRDAKDFQNNVVAIVYDILANLIQPAILITKDWGDLAKSAEGLEAKKEFIGDLESFVTFLSTTKQDLESIVEFDVDHEFYRDYLSTTKLLKDNAIKSDIVKKVEAITRLWAKHIERVLTQFAQLRREDEFVGPTVEIAYWRRQLARFTSIVDFLNTDECRAHVLLLQYGRSSTVKLWIAQDNLVTDAQNQCQDNVKHLYALEKFWEPLYRVDPTKIPYYLPSLLYALRMNFTTSRYYNTTANVTAILVKISNQMIASCRKYMNCDGTQTVWSQLKKVVLEKATICLDLYLKYYQCFKHVLMSMEEAGEPPFNCSEMYVFGKYETFKTRIEDICDVLKTVTKYSILESSKIEGIDVYAKKFKDYFLKISLQKYDALNHRLDSFNKDFAEYKRNVADTEFELEEFVGTSLDNYLDVDNVLRLLKRFEKLNLECLQLDERYLEAMELFQDEIEALRDRYNEERQNPLIPRNMPPICGRIMWIRQLYKRIEEPMDCFKTHKRVMQHRKIQKCIQQYNSLACVFVHYEQIYHKAWSDNITQVRSGLSAPILTKHPKTKRFIVNFDQYIIESIREAEYMYKLCLCKFNDKIEEI